MERTKAILVDITKCIGCRSCEQACKEAHGFPKDTEAKLSTTALTVIEEHGDKYVRRMCMHCQDPACASACLVGALKKTALGPVTYDKSKCIGCRYCLVACPFSVPRYEWTRLVPYVKKCDMCAARQESGQPPACVEACPTGASIVGRRDAIVVRHELDRQRAPPGHERRVYPAQERLARGDVEVMQQLTYVKGIGRWTVEMFLIFALGRLDVFPVDDLGIRKAIRARD